MKRLNRMARLIVLVLVTSLVPSTLALASWQENGSPICTSIADQEEAQVTSDGAGGAIITWEDYRSGNYDIYAQRVDSYGTVMWTADGEAICTATGNQQSPQIAPDGAGGAIIVWQDSTGSDWDIYAQRVDSYGTVMWTADGEAISTATGDQHKPQIIPDGAGGAVVTWYDYRSGTDFDVYAQRVNVLGGVVWTADGEPISTATGDQGASQITSDGAGGAIITWHDSRSGALDIYAQRIGTSGTVMWTVDGEPICTATLDQIYPEITPDSAGGAIITWRDARSGDNDIYAQRLHALGGVMWTADGEPICTATDAQEANQIISDGAGGAIITWHDYRSGTDFDVYAQRVNVLGGVVWTADGEPISIATGDQGDSQITSDGAGGAIITWHDSRSGTWDIYAQRVGTSGTVMWTADGEPISAATSAQRYAQLTSDGAGGAIITWQDYRSGDYDIYAQRVERNGYWGYPASDTHAVRDVPGDEGEYVNLAWDASRLDPWPEMLITQYTIWRAISPTYMTLAVQNGASLLTAVSDVEPESEEAVVLVGQLESGSHYWELISAVEAYYLETYSKVLPTLFDSTSVSGEYHYFQVIAHTGDPGIFWISEPDSGRSVDDLSPGPPVGLKGDYMSPPSELVMAWDPNMESDLSHYAVYKGTAEGFIPDVTNRIGEPVDTFFVDAAFDPNVDNYYKVSAWDIHENESGFSLLRQEEISGTPNVLLVTVLEQNEPNPFSPVTVIRFSIAEPGRVRLVVFDVAGRPVRTLIDGAREPDRYAVTWDGACDGGGSVAPGVYFYKLEAPGYVETMKMVLLQ